MISIYDLAIDILKSILGVLVRVIMGYYLWNYAICQHLGVPHLSGLTIFHIWLFITVLISSIEVEQMVIDEEDNN